MGHYLSEFYPIPPPKTICWKSITLKHKWTNDAYYHHRGDKNYINLHPEHKPGEYVIPHLLFCINCGLEHQP